MKLPVLVGSTLEDKWYIEFFVQNENTGELVRFRKSKRFSDLKSIEEKRSYGLKQLAYWDARLRDLKYDPFGDNIVVITDQLEYKISPYRLKKSEYNLQYFINQFFTEKQGLLRAKSYSTYMAKARIFLAWAQDQKIHDTYPKMLTIPMVTAFSQYLIRNRQVHNRSHNAYIETMHSIWEFLKGKKVVDHNIWREVQKKRFYSQSMKPFSIDQSDRIREFLGKTNPWLLFFCEFTYHTLVRPYSEQTRLKVSDIDFQNQELLVRGEISKNKKTQRVAIPNRLMERIREYKIVEYPGDFFIFGRFCPSPDPVSVDFFSKIFRAVLTELNIGKEWSMYSWKHTMNQRAAMNGVPVKELQIQNRHHSLDQMDTYLKGLTVKDAKSLFDKIPNL